MFVPRRLNKYLRQSTGLSARRVDRLWADGAVRVQRPGAPGAKESSAPGKAWVRKGLERLCRKLGDPTSPPERAPACGPPYFASNVVRRALGEQLGQQELFDGA